MATSSGVVKKTSLEQFSRPRTSGIIAVGLKDDDALVGAAITDGAADIMLFGTNGKAIRFKESDVRTMGRTASGVRGIKLPKGESVVSLQIASEDCQVLTATEHGYGKRTPVAEYSVQGRGGQGIKSIQTSQRNGAVVGAQLVSDEHEIMLISNGGTLVRTRVDDISVVGRNTQGVRLIRLGKEEKLVGVERIEALNGDDEEVVEEGGEDA